MTDDVALDLIKAINRLTNEVKEVGSQLQVIYRDQVSNDTLHRGLNRICEKLDRVGDVISDQND